MFTDADLTRIYYEANGLDPKKLYSITTERIFKAMRKAAEEYANELKSKNGLDMPEVVGMLASMHKG